MRRMSANGQSVASGQKWCRSGKLAQVGRASAAYVIRSRGNLPANAKLDGLGVRRKTARGRRISLRRGQSSARPHVRQKARLPRRALAPKPILDVGRLPFDPLRDFQIRPFYHHHVARTLLFAWLAPGQKLLALNGVDEYAEPAAVLPDDADRNRTLVSTETVVDDRDHGLLAGLRRPADHVHVSGVERQHARRRFDARPQDQFTKLEEHQNSTASVDATWCKVTLLNQ